MPVLLGRVAHHPFAAMRIGALLKMSDEDKLSRSDSQNRSPRLQVHTSGRKLRSTALIKGLVLFDSRSTTELDLSS